MTRPAHRTGLPEGSVEKDPVLESPDELEEWRREEEAAVGETLEAPRADAAEQHRELSAGPGSVPPSPSAGYEANPADAAEQARIVEQDEDDYR
ncbi:hypothetical protein [Allostreptomyces psammosilenae]|uniref:Uncharacterized protein n=1 Tax=Allostreptomyces psammosilenae TaxID=1892865 RepID=A0A853A0G4_9ACTN|nr:hypothetical protein [Allostreptomyces psammosilenae]NYI08113.1 hypothetical protein [Allostreptomyces psammosilenae]